jgi:hypothetical protein
MRRVKHTQIVVRTERVELEQLARVILVRTRDLIGVVVEIEQHGRTGADVFDHFAEIAEHVFLQRSTYAASRSRSLPPNCLNASRSPALGPNARRLSAITSSGGKHLSTCVSEAPFP